MSAAGVSYALGGVLFGFCEKPPRFSPVGGVRGAFLKKLLKKIKAETLGSALRVETIGSNLKKKGDLFIRLAFVNKRKRVSGSLLSIIINTLARG